MRKNTDLKKIFQVRNLDADENNWILEQSYKRFLEME